MFYMIPCLVQADPLKLNIPAPCKLRRGLDRRADDEAPVPLLGVTADVLGVESARRSAHGFFAPSSHDVAIKYCTVPYHYLVLEYPTVHSL
eukprot:scaffold24735_cov54-Attheya_sp.AAC.3